ncbi:MULTISPECIES: hypothetical protein [Pseudomonas]|uniref:Uncharacterized protein n=2 Tax=Pseudomonas TaxID=286 RepID=A0AAD0L3E6_PSEPU|nr:MULTISPECIES: hypothetical protein [Pseudomonas]QXI42451.1 hypothetical protein HU734_019695 [Pseudomonas wayambapalatensis]ANC02204.1 hypothetical protein AB688_08685 [Pseudomonas putida]AXA23823.1 hypothetical protein C1S65_06680 [Pseudomonas putida]KAB5623305.1 hypothetical protein F7234_12990 [Pseudomonas putida]MBC3421650.1 hypothetical protein [Pseudomonas sp. RW3S2]
MKLDPAISAKLAVLQPNQIGMMAWTLLAHPHPPTDLHAGGVPHQPDPDTPQPPEPGEHPPMEPGEPTLPDEPPPAPVA